MNQGKKKHNKGRLNPNIINNQDQDMRLRVKSHEPNQGTQPKLESNSS
jgi:hypothetical protein